MSFHKILCPIDFSECSHEAMLTALDLAHAEAAELTLLHVFSPPIGYADVMGPSSESAVLAVQEAVDNELARWRVEAEATGVTVHASNKMGGAASAILHAARTGGHDLIVIGTHGRSGFKHFVLGSVAEKVVRKAPCPVMTVHSRAAATEHAATHV